MTTAQDSPRIACHSLVASVRSLQLATVGQDGIPHIGYTPFVCTPEPDVELATAVQEAFSFTLFVSELALHTRDMLSTPVASIMMIEDEADGHQIFARKRLYYECDVQLVAADEARYATLLEQYRLRHGKMVDLLKTLPDFRLFTLVPRSGQFVMGFGKAFKLTGENLQEFESSRRA